MNFKNVDQSIVYHIVHHMSVQKSIFTDISWTKPKHVLVLLYSTVFSVLYCTVHICRYTYYIQRNSGNGHGNCCRMQNSGQIVLKFDTKVGLIQGYKFCKKSFPPALRIYEITVGLLESMWNVEFFVEWNEILNLCGAYSGLSF